MLIDLSLFARRLFANPAAVNVNRLTRQVAGVVGCEKGDYFANLAGFARTAERDLCQYARKQIRPFHDPRCHVGVD